MNRKTGALACGEAFGPPRALRIAGWCLFFSIVTNFLMLTVPIYMMHVYDDVIGTGSIETLVALTAIAVALVVVFGLLDGIRSRILARAAVWLERTLAGPIAARSIEWTADTTGNDREATLNDLATVRAFLSSPTVVAFFDAPLMVVFLLVAFLLHPVFGLVTFCAAALLGALAVANDFLTRRPFDQALQTSQQARRWFTVATRQKETVDALGLGGRVIERWQEGFVRTQLLQLRAGEAAGAVAAASRALRLSAQIAVLATGATLVLENAVTAGVMIAASFIIARALAPMESALNGWRQARAAHLSWRRVRATLARPPRRKGTMTLPTPAGRLTVDGLGYTLPGAAHPLLANLSFKLEPGQRLAILGASGIGKSTLARLLVGIELPEAGHVRLDGASLFDWDRATLSTHLGYLPQHVDLIGDSVAEAIARLGPVEPDAIIDAARRAGAHEMILRLPGGYTTPIIGGGRNLSRGQQQWIALARALYGRPKLVVLDEPDAHLDGRGERALTNALETLRREGATVILLGHRRSLAANADMVLVIEGPGRARFGPERLLLTAANRDLPNRQISARPDLPPLIGPGGTVRHIDFGGTS